jgi:hypothetical protein
MFFCFRTDHYDQRRSKVKLDPRGKGCSALQEGVGGKLGGKEAETPWAPGTRAWFRPAIGGVNLKQAKGPRILEV